MYFNRILTYEVIVTHLVDVSSILRREKYFNESRTKFVFFTNKITVLEYLTLIFYIEHLTSLCSVLYSHTEGWHSIFTEIFLRVER